MMTVSDALKMWAEDDRFDEYDDYEDGAYDYDDYDDEEDRFGLDPGTKAYLDRL